MKSVEKIASNADEKPVQSTTSTKISHTWLASQTGPDRPVDQLARPPAAVASAGEQAPEPGAEVRAAEDGVHRRADPEDDGDGVGLAHRGAPGRVRGRPDSGPYGTSSSRSSSLRQRRDIARSVMIRVAPSAT